MSTNHSAIGFIAAICFVLFAGAADARRIAVIVQPDRGSGAKTSAAENVAEKLRYAIGGEFKELTILGEDATTEGIEAAAALGVKCPQMAQKCLIDLGNTMELDLLLVGELTKIGRKWRLSASAYEMKSGQKINQRSEEFSKSSAKKALKKLVITTEQDLTLVEQELLAVTSAESLTHEKGEFSVEIE